jgi:hypothetical protein
MADWRVFGEQRPLTRRLAWPAIETGAPHAFAVTRDN